MKKIIEESGLGEVVGHAKDGIEGVKMLNETKPDIVFLDILMPNMDGIQALRAMLAVDKNLKVIMLTSLGGAAEKVEHALRLGAKAVASKPFEPEKIKELLKTI